MLGFASIVAATVLAWVALVPQVVKLARGRDPEGVSPTWPAFGLVSNVAWVAYLIGEQLWAAIPATAVAGVFYAAVIAYLASTPTPMAPVVARGTVWTAVLVACLGVGGWTSLGLLLGWSYAVQVAPAVWSAHRTPAPSGVSVGTWSLLTVEALLWGVYGWSIADAPLLAYGFVGVTAGAAILVRYARTRHRLVAAPA